MSARRIRPKAVAAVRRGDDLLVSEDRDPVKRETYFVPLGGEIEFGESAWDAVSREFLEEVQAKIVLNRQLGILESVFTLAGEPAHEIVFVFAASFVDPACYERDEFRGTESDGSFLRASWIPLRLFRDGQARLYPEGLLELLDGDAGAGGA